MGSEPQIAVVVPCLNEEKSVAYVVREFSEALPSAEIYVFDNASTDATAVEAADAGAIVRRVDQPGKGNVVRRMFADVEADVYVLVDGDGTYDARSAPALVEAVLSGADLVNGSRVPDVPEAFPSGHRLGNRVLSQLVARAFSQPVGDMLSGYKACSRRFVKSFPVASTRFEIETELMVHALELNVPIREVDTPYWERTPGSVSKLSTMTDGASILGTIIGLVRYVRPLVFFSVVALALAATGIALGIPIVVTFAHIHKVPRFPTAILATGLMILSCLCFLVGLLLDTVSRARREQSMLAYLALAGPLALSEGERPG